METVWEDGKLLEMAAGGGCTSMWVCLLPLNCVLKDGRDGKFTTIKKNQGQKSLKQTERLL